ncbi:fibrobacter succinogenes major paralogous domain-containing protein [Kordia sp. YSTF-M3]|uniref:Fibrobacter succinogenes major paralogous domain-containing protein n=1 Tax=Kordia aestuariivivens TaxID=2759037 RepID=A0ABR7Q5M1_9FLAO|nr:FISUMP domain-containing protein [Kordia aestuariivivens]MBC8753842.1 fibrobacter succinogenes major paralogous domain-containing protein [Kordia aestuariivivens]
MKKLLQLSLFTFCTLLFINCSSDDDTTAQQPGEQAVNPVIETVTDIDGNVYNTVQLGNQLWMLENLKTTKFNDGTAISEWTFGDNWNQDNRTFPFYRWADTSDLNNLHDEELPEDFYGAVYNDAALNSGKLAPEGWRIPTEQDWIVLKSLISADGQLGNEGTALKSTTGWAATSGVGTDLYGFNGLPNGYVTNFGTSTAVGVICTWATSDTNTTDLTRRVINILENTMEFDDNSWLLGAGVRCIKIQ